MDSLRYWVLEMHVDGFRFDLASALARELHEVDRLGAFFDIIHQDPVLSQVKLIAEPWDLGEGGYQVGNFPPGWTEWNGKYRDTVRDYWQGRDGRSAELAYPPDRLQRPLRARRAGAPRPASTSSPPTTASPCATWSATTQKHNEANGEDNRDGTDDNLQLELRRRRADRRPWRSCRCGSGRSATSWPRCCSPRACRCCSPATSWGAPSRATTTPTARTTRSPGSTGTRASLGQRLHAFVRRLIRLRMAHPIFRRRRFFEGCEIGDSGAKDILWLKPDGEEMDTESWNAPGTRAIGAFLNGLGLGEMDRRGHLLDDDNFLLLLNAGSEDIDFRLPTFPGRGRWGRVLDTALQEGARTGDHYQTGDVCPVQGRSITVLRQHRQMGNGNGDGQ